MPQQLIYTSAPRGVVAGRSGHCTVARSAAMREALMLQLEKLSYYQHLSLSGGQERPIYSCRVVDIRGSRYHVLSRIQDAGLDFTGRTNFLAHHLVFTPEEVRQFPSPPVILRGWSGWVKSWSKEPQLLDKEDWSGLAGLSGSVSVPATNWQQVTGDAVNGYGLLESRAGIAFRVDDLAEEKILGLFAESLELLELRDPRRDFRATAWQYNFTTSMQEQDNPADFRWRCLHSDNPAFNRFAGPDCRPLSDVRALRVTDEETMFARSGRQPPRFVIQPQNVRSTEGETSQLQAKAEGVPSPSYQWFALDRGGNGQLVANGTEAELVVQNPPLGLSRYVVRASNSQGDITSEVATLSVEPKLRLAQSRPVSEVRDPTKPASPSYVKSADDIERQRKRLHVEQAQQLFQKRLRRNKILVAILATVLIACVSLFIRVIFYPNKSFKKPSTELNKKKDGDKNSPSSQPPVNAPVIAPTIQADSSLDKNLLADEKAVQAESNQKQDLTPILQTPTESDWPSEWIQMRIGKVSNFHADYIPTSPLKFQLSAAAEGFGTNGDNLFFVCKTNTAMGFQASLPTNPNDPPWPPGSMRGIMIRESQSPVSSFLFIGASSQKIFAFRRATNGGVLLKQETDLPKAVEGFAVILKFDQQKDDQLVSAYSFDHDNWEPCQAVAFPTNAQLLVGFALCSGNTSTNFAAHFIKLFPNDDSGRKK
jgi:hypothetical protein